MQGDEGAVNKSRRAAVLLVIAVFVLGIALGVLGTYLEGYRVFGAAIVHRPPRPDRSPAAQQHEREARVEQMTKDLGLTPEQQQKLDAALTQMSTTYGGIRQQYGSQMDVARKQGRDSIRAILTPEQVAKFDETMRKMDEERKKMQGNN
jgi:Spy/CpxP family protein refolding chaperone